MANIAKYKDKWRAQVYRMGARTSKVFATKREAQEWALREEVALSAVKSNKTLASAVKQYLETVTPTKGDKALAWETKRFGYMAEYFGEMTRLAAIDSAWIGRWRDHRLKTVSGATVLRESNLLRNLFTIACDEWHWIETNPFRGVRLPKDSEARHQLWGWRQIKTILRAGQESGGKIQEVTEAFHISLRTAMRLQEVLAAPDHFDARRRVVRVKTKTARGGEDIPITRQGAKLLQRQPFTVGANEASTLFSKLVKQKMLGDLHFHDARATALTLLAKKVDVMVLARISRHRNISLLYRVYYRESAEDISKRL